MGAPLGEVFEAAAFVEKPDLDTARAYVAEGEYVWNAGYFLFRANRMLQEMQRFRPDIAEAARGSVRRGSPAGEDALLLDVDAFAACPSDSIDYAVMEKADRIAVARMDAGWSDLGSWEAVWEASGPDDKGNATSGDVVLQEASGCLVRTDGPIVTVRGVEDLVVVVSDGAVLVLPRERSQEVKHLVEALKAQERTELL
jgi:mannose-1-phosphate guanylyltransferase/mannose-6-phosphate isomerase